MTRNRAQAERRLERLARQADDERVLRPVLADLDKMHRFARAATLELERRLLILDGLATAATELAAELGVDDPRKGKPLPSSRLAALVVASVLKAQKE